MENWDEIRTAYQVARLGTVSGAAEVLGVHHATVIRHIDALEKRLGAKLFQRHARGYTATEAGRDLLPVAQTTEEQFAHLSSRIKGQGETVAGELVVTSIAGIADLLTPVMVSFQEKWPEVRVRFLTDMRVFRLDYGEAHVAIRAGSRAGGAGQRGAAPGADQDGALRGEVLCRPPRQARVRGGVRRPPLRLLRQRGDARAVSPLAAGDGRSPTRSPIPRPNPPRLEAAVRQGAGIGFHLGLPGGARIRGWSRCCRPRPEWEAPLRIVTHVDLHRTRKVQAFLTHLKESAKSWKFCDGGQA